MSKVLLLVCIVTLSAISVSAQCTHSPIAKPLRVRLLMESGVPIIAQNAFLSGLRSISDIEIRSGVSDERVDVVVSVTGTEIKASGKVLGHAWDYEVYRYWVSCGVGVPTLVEHFNDGLRVSDPSNTETVVREDVAEINVKAFEKLRQERDLSKH